MSCLNLFSLIDIEQLQILQDFSAPLADHFFYNSGFNFLRNHHGNITGYRREFRDSLELAFKRSERKDLRHIKYSYICALTDSVVFQYHRMNLAEIPDNISVISDQCLASGMKEWFSGFRIVFYPVMHADLSEEFLCHTFHIVEIALAVKAQSKLHSLIRKLCQRQFFRNIYISEFIETDILVATVVVGRKGCQHAVQRSRPHDRKILTQRVGNRNSLSDRIILREQKLVEGLRTLEGVAHPLRKSAVLCHVSCLRLNPVLERQSPGGCLSGRQCRRNIIITEESRNFLRNIAGPVDILPEGRSHDLIRLLIISEFHRGKILQLFLR